MVQAIVALAFALAVLNVWAKIAKDETFSKRMWWINEIVLVIIIVFATIHANL